MKLPASTSVGVYEAPVSPTRLTQSVRPLGERCQAQLTEPEIGLSSSSRTALTSTRAWMVAVSVVSVTVPGSSSFPTVIVTSIESSMVAEELPRPSFPSWTSIVTS